MFNITVAYMCMPHVQRPEDNNTNTTLQIPSPVIQLNCWEYKYNKAKGLFYCGPLKRKVR